MKNVLITSAGRRVVLVRIFKKALAESGIGSKVFTADMNPHYAPACYESDGYFQVPRCTSDAYIEALIGICRENDVGIVVPTIDTELPALAQGRGLLESMGVQAVVSSPAFIETCRDKRLTMRRLKEFGIAVPEIMDMESPVFPLFAKPYDGSRSQNTHIINRREDLTPEILNDPKLLFMECIDKEEYREFTVDMYYGLDSQVKGIVPRERIEVRDGEISKGITRKNFLVRFLRERMGFVPGARGCICLQLFCREDGDIKGIEINPRFGGGYPLSYYAGADYPMNIVREYLLGEPVGYTEDWTDGTLMLRYDEDVIVRRE